MPATPAEIQDRLNSAHQVVGGHQLDSKQVINLQQQGWLPDDLTAVSRLAAHAVAAGTAFRSAARAGADNTLEQALTARLIKRTARLAKRLYRDELTDMPTQRAAIEVALTWAEVIVALPDQTSLARLDAQYLREVPAYQALCGALAPSVYAAGLSLDEVRDRLAARTLDADGIHTLVALRGLRWPSIT